MHIHILGICGTAMVGFARIATQLGHRVTGADANVYPPMSDVLQRLQVDVHEGYGPESLSPRPDLVLVGNALSRGNPAIEAVLNLGIPYTSGPEWLGREVLARRQVIAVAGTHGKTTTSALITHILRTAGLSPGFMIGGQVPDLGSTAELGTGETFVIEADEYDTAFFDKRSKFLHYHPDCLIINNLEFDHADIFPDLAAIETQFHHVVRVVPGRGRILANATGDAIARVLARGVWSEVMRFGNAVDAQIRPAEAVDAGAPPAGTDDRPRQSFRVLAPATAGASGSIDVPISTTLLGAYSRENICAAVGACLFAGVDPDAIASGVASFRGVTRRLEPIYRGPASAPVTVYDDFAHHPTAIAATLEGLRAAYPGARILAVVEPRSNTMRMGVHRDSLLDALADADAAMLLLPEDFGWGLDTQRGVGRAGQPAALFSDIAPMAESLAARAGEFDHIVLMSNGAFGGLPRTLPQRLAERFGNHGGSAGDALSR